MHGFGDLIAESAVAQRGPVLATRQDAALHAAPGGFRLDAGCALCLIRSYRGPDGYRSEPVSFVSITTHTPQAATCIVISATAAGQFAPGVCDLGTTRSGTKDSSSAPIEIV